MKELNNLRKRINNIDNEILKNLVLRKEIVKEIGKYKRKNNIKVIDKKREKELLDNLIQKSNKYNLNPKYINSIYRVIIKYSRSLQ